MALSTLTPAVIPKKQLANRCGMWNRPVSWNFKRANCWMNIPFPLGGNSLEVGWGNYRSNPNFNGTGNNEELIAATTGVTRRAVLEVVGVGRYPLYGADGSRDVYWQPGEVKALYLNNQSIPAGNHVLRWFTIYDDIPSRWGTFSSNQASLVCKNELGDDLTDRTSDVSWNSPPNPEGFAIDPPQFIVGNNVSKKSVMILGDSIGTEGQSDGGYVSDLGFIMRACVTAGIPFINNGAGGKAAWQYASMGAGFLASLERRMSIVPYGSVGFFFLQMCTNDIAWGLNSATMISNLPRLKQIAASKGAKLIPFTCPPRTNNTNTAKPTSDGVNAWQYRNEYNDHIRANNGVGSGYFDLALALEESNTNLWKTGMFNDGIHPVQAGHTAAYNALLLKLPELFSTYKN